MSASQQAAHLSRLHGDEKAARQHEELEAMTPADFEAGRMRSGPISRMARKLFG
ncbi:hypothetical protein M8Z33_19970 [Streptomyces sp. ZAF1911]|uniref:hypothetical protein n=1 Tax=Streptomyces sp. ZAF1911 TaxID=2944129 RepID=UPI00237C1F99|nr:hypothetical protein [Streptomyces sp. ZAF1911]MDD9378895.1 hypothetical protein [Streptomyces sp. ZAF1911]